MINGIVYDFESIKLTLPSGQVLMCDDISYKDKKDNEVITGMNGLPVGVGFGEYSGSCDLTLGRTDYERMAASGPFFNMGEVPIIVSYGHAGQVPVVDSLMVHFNDRDFSAKKGDKNLKVAIKGVITAPIITNGKPAYTPM